METRTCLFCQAPMGTPYLDDVFWRVRETEDCPNSGQTIRLVGITHVPCTNCDKGSEVEYPCVAQLHDLIQKQVIDRPVKFLDGVWQEVA